MKGQMLGRVAALMTSVMDLHVRIALQEADREKRRLIGGGVFLGAGLSLLVLAAIALHLALLLWLGQGLGLSWIVASLVVAGLDLLVGGLLLRLGGGMLKGPYLPETTAGLMRTTRALTGKF